jgi:hypothetical protein
MYLALLYGLIRHLWDRRSGGGVDLPQRLQLHGTASDDVAGSAPIGAGDQEKRGDARDGRVGGCGHRDAAGRIGPRALYLSLALTAVISATWFWVMSAEERTELAPAWRFS